MSGGRRSDRGLELVQWAALFDWLYEDLDEPTRQATIAKIEQAADEAVAHIRGGRAPFFYSRTPGALAGLCVAGLSLDGVSDRAEGYLQTFRQFGAGDFFKAYQWVDGAATGATYTLFYTYVDLPSICAAWWSATDRNPADWIRTQQGDWLDGIVRFYLWYMRPGFAFTDINDQYHRNCISANVVLFTDPAMADDRGDQNSRRGLKTDHTTWDQWLEIRERNGLDVARITDWQVRPSEARCRADLTKTNPDTKCKEWIREFVWLAGKHLVVLDIIETSMPEIRRQWQLHAAGHPEFGDHVLTITGRPPEINWAEPALGPPNPEGRLFCQTLLPQDYRVVLHDDGKAAAFGPAGTPLGAVEGNPYHCDYGKSVVQIDPGTDTTEMVFLHVLTAADAGQTNPPRTSYRISGPGQIELTVDNAHTVLAVPEWFTLQR